MSLAPEPVDATPDVIYFTKHPLYEFMLEKSAPITPDPRAQPPLVQLRFTGQPQPQGIRLPLAALEQFHDALSRLLDYVKQERARGPAIPSSGSVLEGSMASTAEPPKQYSAGDHIEISHPAAYLNRPVSVERLYGLRGIVLKGIRLPLAALEQFHDALSRLLDCVKQERARGPAIPSSGSVLEGSMASTAEPPKQYSAGDHIEISHPAAYLNRPVSVERLYGLSGIVLTGVIALLGWALYSLSVSQSDFRPPQATAAQETLTRASRPAIAPTNDAASGTPAGAVSYQPPAGPAPAVKTSDEPPAQVSLHIQSPAQHEIAQRLVEQLQERGYVIPKAAIVEPKGPPRTEVRYFNPTEAEEATAIAMLLAQPYRAPATSSYIRGRKDASKAQPRRYEIWLGPEPRSRKVRH